MRPLLVAQVVSVGGVKGNPEEDESSILVLAPFGPVQPDKRSMNPQCQAGGVILTLRALSLLE